MHKLLENINGWNQSGPAGNDKQWVLPALGIASSLYGAWQGSRPSETQPVSPSEITDTMKPAQDVIGQMQTGYSQMQNLGKDLINPLSVANQKHFSLLNKQGMNQIGLQNILDTRQSANTGVDSGILRAQQREHQRSLRANLSTQFGNTMVQNRAQGIGVLGQSQGLLGNIFQGQVGIQENIAQSLIAQRQAQMEEERRRRAQTSNLFGGIGEGLMGLYGNIYQADNAVAPTTNIYNTTSG